MINQKVYPTTSFSFPSYSMIFVVVVALLAFILWSEAYYNNNEIMYLYLLILAQLSPIVFSFIRQKYNYLSFVLVNHFVTFSIAKSFLLDEPNILKSTKESLIFAIQELIFCTALLSLSYWIAKFFFYKNAKQTEPFQKLDLSSRQTIFIFIYIVSMPFSLTLLPEEFVIVHLTLCFSGMLLMMCSSCEKKESILPFLELGVPLTGFLYFFISGSLFLIGQYCTFYFVIICLQKKYKRFFSLLSLVVLISAIQTVKGEFRGLIMKDKTLSLVDRIEVVCNLLMLRDFHIFPSSLQFSNSNQDNTFIDGKYGKRNTSLIEGFQRSGDDSLETVLQKTPKEVPFWNGETYWSIPFMFIPRALWPEKPARSFWNKYGRLYGTLSEDDLATSVGVGYFAEAYMNFGFIGLYVCAIFFGILLACIENFCFYILNGNYFFTYIAYLVPVVNFSSDMGTMINSLVVLTVTLQIAKPIIRKQIRTDDYCYKREGAFL